MKWCIKFLQENKPSWINITTYVHVVLLGLDNRPARADSMTNSQLMEGVYILDQRNVPNLATTL